jgi:hypothetical protein
MWNSYTIALHIDQASVGVGPGWIDKYLSRVPEGSQAKWREQVGITVHAVKRNVSKEGVVKPDCSQIRLHASLFLMSEYLNDSEKRDIAVIAAKRLIDPSFNFVCPDEVYIVEHTSPNESRNDAYLVLLYMVMYQGITGVTNGTLRLESRLEAMDRERFINFQAKIKDVIWGHVQAALVKYPYNQRLLPRDIARILG